MKYDKIVNGTFISRPNRFIAQVEIDGIMETVHVKNTGRCKELLVPGARVYLSESDNIKRRTKYDLVAVEKQKSDGECRLINMDSQIVNDVAMELLTEKLFKGYTIKREVTYKSSRFDFYIEGEGRKIFLEVKGVTLENDGVASFPDAPTERGIKHLKELIHSQGEGFEAFVLFIVQMNGVKSFCPNDITHKAFGDALREASDSGVTVLAVDCVVTPDVITYNDYIRVSLSG
ncbi:MAG: DNA/RNA nuclease SfsA [Clostridia bacterium]|nr:DNA/RNA nuclease SfsA [Clostridia bacterium]